MTNAITSNLWKIGQLVIPQPDGSVQLLHYQAKVYDLPSQYGIEGGRISKLLITRDGWTLCSYDRGWDVEPDPDDVTEYAVSLLLEIFK